MIKKTSLILFLLILILAGCAKTETDTETSIFSDQKINGSNVKLCDVYDFYYTYSWIGYDARYQRYRIYREGEQYMFFHETRMTVDDYGYNEEEDRTAIGTIELTDSEIEPILLWIQHGSVRNRTDHIESGDAGPWMYVYANGQSDEGMEFYFADGEQSEFEEYCKSLAEKAN